MNNRIANIRAATGSVNRHNANIRKDNSSGYTGVAWHKASNKYQALIAANNKHMHLGLFITPEEASIAYMLAKIKYHPTSPTAQEYLRELTLAG